MDSLASRSRPEKIAVKLRLNEEYRRFQVPTEIRFKALMKRIQKLTNIKACTLSYEDADKDVVTVDSDYCLRLAVEQAVAAGEALSLTAVVLATGEAVSDSSDEEQPPVPVAAAAAVRAPAPATAPAPAPSTDVNVDALTAALTQTLVPRLVEGLSARLPAEFAAHLRAELERQHQHFHGERAAPAPAAAAASGVVHPRVVCDGCNSRIVGVRYKCMFCPDFDLCSACEDQDLHRPDHLFVKIRRPLAESLQTSVYWNEELVGGTVPTPPPAARDVSPAPAAAAAAAATRDETREESDAESVDTYSSSSEEEEFAPAVETQAAEPVPLFATFVADVSCPDGTQVACGTVFRKVWTVANSGDHAWPAGTTLRHLSGPEGVESAYAVPALPAGERADVAVDIVAPAVEGVFESKWVLAADNGTLFGHGLWCQFNTITNATVSFPAAAAAPPALGSATASDVYDHCELSTSDDFELIPDTGAAAAAAAEEEASPAPSLTPSFPAAEVIPVLDVAAAAAAASAAAAAAAAAMEDLAQTVGKQPASSLASLSSQPTLTPAPAPAPAPAPVPVPVVVPQDLADWLVNVHAPAAPAPVVAEPVAEPAPAPAPVDDSPLGQLVQMGFADMALNETMLARHNGDVSRTIEALLNMA
eukprot:m.29293 g.29293  ORF g.29293 m.29293 type:complete len:647 (-) comp9149_c0_seq2:34-1974(-)